MEGLKTSTGAISFTNESNYNFGNSFSAVTSSTSSQTCGSPATVSEQHKKESSIMNQPTVSIAFSAHSHNKCVSRHSLDKAKKTTNVVPITNSLGKVIVLTKHQISKRSKQINIGKKTKGYIDYVNTIPKRERVIGKHLQTPNPKERISKRRFQGKVRNWRRFLHHWNDATASKVESSIRKRTSQGTAVVTSKLSSKLTKRQNLLKK